APCRSGRVDWRPARDSGASCRERRRRWGDDSRLLVCLLPAGDSVDDALVHTGLYASQAAHLCGHADLPAAGMGTDGTRCSDIAISADAGTAGRETTEPGFMKFEVSAADGRGT